jgi:DNA-binding GntR family transcriptional regulator
MQTDGKCHGTLRLQVYEQLREGILLGKYPKGTALTEIKMSEELGVSRTPVREAFCQLELDGLVAATPNKGVVVEGYDQTDMLDMFEVRSRMESLAAARAASVMPDSDIRKLRSVFEQESELAQTGDFNGLQKSDAAFHDLIFRGSGSKVLQNLLSSINIYTRQARYVSLAALGRSEQVIKEHESILVAIETRNVSKAEKSMQKHIENAAASYKKLAAETGGSR